MAGWAAKAWPPATDELPVLLLRTAETVAMAAIGTTAAAVLALPLCILAARNVTPSLALYYPARWFLNALRGIDSFVFALLFVAAVGLGPFAASSGSRSTPGAAPPSSGPRRSRTSRRARSRPPSATGASRMKVIAYALLPDVAPSMVSIGALLVGVQRPAPRRCSAWWAPGGIGQELEEFDGPP